MVNFIVWILFGLVAGAIAKFLMPGKDPGGWIVTILLGVAGSFVGGFIGRKVLGVAAGGNSFDLVNLLFAIGGALLLLLAYRFFTKAR
ncbi:MAG: GlsB/YeaQ/YmgE family stress response membrane protein [Chitinophagales bacterium]|nr:GlsB/YeaQ/YmgE family stress response membrane protein [Chitinophagales bacterium]